MHDRWLIREQLRSAGPFGVVTVGLIPHPSFVGYLDCPFCCTEKTIQVFGDGLCVCVSCPRGWHQHTFHQALEALKVKLPSRRLVPLRPVIDRAARARILFSDMTYGRGPYAYGSHSGHKSVLLG